MSPSLLLVCQEELRAQLSMRMIRASGMEVNRVGRPEEVAKSLQTFPDIRVVLCDWRMPAPAGAEWVESWRSLVRNHPIHFLLMTDRLPTPSEAETIFKKGVSDVWIRPVPDYLLVPRLQVWIQMDRGAAGDGGDPSGSGPLNSDLVDVDTLLIGRRIFLDQAEGMYAGSRRLGTYVGFLAVAISNIENVLARLGPPGKREAAMFLATELRATKRREDLLGRWNEDVFVLASYFPKGESVEAFGRRVLGALQNARFPQSDQVGPLRFTVSGAWGPSRDHVMARDALDAIVCQAKASSAG